MFKKYNYNYLSNSNVPRELNIKNTINTIKTAVQCGYKIDEIEGLNKSFLKELKDKLISNEINDLLNKL